MATPVRPDTIADAMADALDGQTLTADSWTTTLERSADPTDPTRQGSVCIDGAFVVLCDVDQVEGLSVPPATGTPVEKWRASYTFDVLVTLLVPPNKTHRWSMYIAAGRKIVNLLDVALTTGSTANYNVMSRSLPRLERHPGSDTHYLLRCSYVCHEYWDHSA